MIAHVRIRRLIPRGGWGLPVDLYVLIDGDTSIIQLALRHAHLVSYGALRHAHLVSYCALRHAHLVSYGALRHAHLVSYGALRHAHLVSYARNTVCLGKSIRIRTNEKRQAWYYRGVREDMMR